MTEKTARLIEGMKAQTYGVEVEGNGITRQKAAQVAAGFFGTGRYENTAYRNGYMTWSAWDQQGREWKFSRDVSIKGPDDQKCELVTPVLTYDDLETFLELLRQLRHAGMKSSPSRGCGVHIHVGLNGTDGRNHDARSLRNLVNIMAAHESQIGRAIKIDEGRTGHYCKTVSPDFLKRVNREKPQTMEALAACWYEGNHAVYGRTQHYNESRYHMLYAEYKNYAEKLLRKPVVSVLSAKISQHKSLQPFEKCLQIRIIIPVRHIGSVHPLVHRLQGFTTGLRVSLRINLRGFNGLMSEEITDVNQVFARFYKVHGF